MGQMRSDIRIYNEDCMPAMAKMADNEFDLAIVDPPYGLNFGSFNRTNKAEGNKRIKADKYKNSDWDKSIPTNEYFNELMRASKNQIIWGGNYFPLPPTQCFIFWYKQNPVPNFSDGELAWTSFKMPAKCFNYKCFGNIEGSTSASKKIHPTQKPVQLYKWLLQNYAKEGDRILDTHLGSGSIALACWDLCFDLTGYEIDKEYYDGAIARLERHKSQGQLF